MADDFSDSGMHSTMPERIPIMQILIALAALGLFIYCGYLPQ
jgi:hypothetical protein